MTAAEIVSRYSRLLERIGGEGEDPTQRKIAILRLLAQDPDFRKLSKDERREAARQAILAAEMRAQEIGHDFDLEQARIGQHERDVDYSRSLPERALTAASDVVRSAIPTADRLLSESVLGGAGKLYAALDTLTMGAFSKLPYAQETIDYARSVEEEGSLPGKIGAELLATVPSVYAGGALGRAATKALEASSAIGGIARQLPSTARALLEEGAIGATIGQQQVLERAGMGDDVSPAEAAKTVAEYGAYGALGGTAIRGLLSRLRKVSAQTPEVRKLIKRLGDEIEREAEAVVELRHKIGAANMPDAVKLRLMAQLDERAAAISKKYDEMMAIAKSRGRAIRSPEGDRVAVITEPMDDKQLALELSRLRGWLERSTKEELLKAREAAGLPVIKGESHEQLRERLYRVYEAKLSGKEPEQVDLIARRLHEPVEPERPVTWGTAERAAAGRPPAREELAARADEVLKKAGIEPMEAVAAESPTAVPELWEKKPPKFPVNVPQLGGGDDAAMVELHQALIQIEDRLKSLKTTRTAEDTAEIMGGRPELMTIDVANPEKTIAAVKEIGGGLQEQSRRLAALRRQYARAFKDKRARELALNAIDEVEAQIKREAEKYDIIGNVAGRLLKAFDLGVRQIDLPADAGPGEIVKALVAKEVEKYPELADAWASAAQVIDADDYIGARALEAAFRRIPKDPAQRRAWLRKVLTEKLPRTFRTYFYANILSGPGTHARNVISNSFVQLASILEDAMASWYARALGVRAADPVDVVAELWGVTDGAVRGALAAARVLSGRQDPFVALFLSGPQKAMALTGEQVQSIGGTLAKLYTMPNLRLLVAEDTAFKVMSFDRALHKLAAEELRKRGVTSAKEIAEKLPAFIREVANGKHPQLIQKALQRAEYETFMDEPGAIVKGLGALIEHVPVLRHVFPFIRVTGRLMSYSAERIPFLSGGVKIGRAISRYSTERTHEAGAELAQELAKNTLGILFMVPLIMGALSGRIRGAQPGFTAKQRRAREAMYVQGGIPKAVKVGGSWVGVSGFEPFDTYITLAGALADAEKESEGPEDFLAKAVAEALPSMLDKSFIAGLEPLTQLLLERNAGPMARMLLRQVTPQEALMRSITRGTYEKLPESRRPLPLEAAVSSVAAEIPGVAQKFPVRYDIWGNEVTFEQPGPVRFLGTQFYSREKKDEVTEFLERLGVLPGPLRPVQRVDFGGESVKVELKPYEMNVIAQTRRELHSALERMLPRLKRLAARRPDLAYKAAKTLISRFSRVAQARLRKMLSWRYSKDRARRELMEQAIQKWAQEFEGEGF